MKRHLTIGTLALACLTMMAACGSADANGTGQVASLADSSGATTTTTAAGGDSTGTDKEADAQQAMLDFARCMREQGIDMPDPQFSSEGGGMFSVGQSGPDSPIDRAKLDGAQKACQSYLDKVDANRPPPDPAKVEEQKQQMLAFAQCMRDHGIDFPDPEFDTTGGGLTVQMGGPGMDPASPGFKEANDTCAKEAGMPAMGTPGPAADGQSTAEATEVPKAVTP
jgi:hypothetical protein